MALQYSETIQQQELDKLTHDMATFLASSSRSQEDIQAAASTLEKLTPNSKKAAQTMLSIVVNENIVTEEEMKAAGPSSSKKHKR
jgi:hypothetical protein